MKNVFFSIIVVFMLALSMLGNVEIANAESTNIDVGNLVYTPTIAVKGINQVVDVTFRVANVDQIDINNLLDLDITVSNPRLDGNPLGNSLIVGNLNPANIRDLAVGAEPRNVEFTVNIGANTVAGNYIGTIKVEDINDAERDNFKEIQYTINVQNIDRRLSVSGLDENNEFVIVSEEDNTVTKEFTLQNSGNVDLSNLNFKLSGTFTDGTYPIGFKVKFGSDVNAVYQDVSLDQNLPIQNIVLTPTQTLIVSLQVRVPDNIDLDTYTGNMFISDLGNNVVLSTIPLIIKIEPEICSDGIVGNLRLTINNPDKGDDSKIGDEISIETEVENKENKDMDVIVEAVLYDLDRAKKILTVESDSVEVEKNSKEDIDFTMIVPNDEDIDPDNTYILYIKAYEDGDEDVNCIYKSVEVDLERDDDDVIISSFIINPTIVSQGEMVSFRVEAENIGTDEQKDSYIILRNTELNLNLKSNLFTLKKYDKSGKDYIITQTFTVPADAVAKDYTIEAVVYYNNGRDSKNSFGTLTVQTKTAEGTETVETEGTQGITPTTGAGTFQPTGASIFDKLGDTKTLFIIGDIVLVILAVLFLVLIFKKR